MKWLVALAVLITAAGGWAEVIDHGPIFIHSVEDLLGLASGLGTVISPFVLKGLRVDANGAPFGIFLANVRAPLILRDLEVYGAAVAAIRLHNVENVVVENVVVRGSLTGLLISGGRKIVLRGIRAENCEDGVRLMFSEGIALEKIHVSKTEVGIWFQGVRSSILTNSVIERCGLGLLLELASVENVIAENAFRQNHEHVRSCGGNQFDNSRRGNFWEGFVAPDNDGDGILNEPYLIGLDVDRFPLAFPPGG